jgi:DNA repair protein RadC
MMIYEAKIQYTLVSLGDDVSLSTPAKLAEYLKGAFDDYPQQEQLWVVPLDRKNHPLARIMVSLGTATSSLVHAREVFKPCILAGATAVAVAHNHPSGSELPSTADLQVTRNLRQAAEVLGIELLDHLVIGDSRFYSFREAGLI